MITALYIPFKLEYRSETSYIVWKYIEHIAVRISYQYCNYCAHSKNFVPRCPRLSADLPVHVNVGGYYVAIKQRIDSYYTAIESCIYLLSVATLYLKIGEVHAIQRMIMFPHPPFHAPHFSVDAVA